MGDSPGSEMVKYIHGTTGKGSWAFYGGHDPEDYTHTVGDPPTQLELHKNSPGYRLILNNVLFPATKKKERKGARLCMNFREKLGVKSSLKNIFMASANGWNKPRTRNPKILARFAPILSCMTALSFLSAHVRYKLKTKNQNIAKMILIRMIKISITFLPEKMKFLFSFPHKHVWHLWIDCNSGNCVLFF